MMLHRMKLRVVYGQSLAGDKPAKRLKMRVILLAGLAVLPPFMVITYYLFSETNPVMLMSIGTMSALSCVPVVLYAYAKGFGKPLAELWKERPEELKWLSLKIGFLYGFGLYWMILGIVEFLFGYRSFRAALISFVASAAARDGFEIGYHRSKGYTEGNKMRIFPDNRPITEMLPLIGKKVALLLSAAIITGSLIGALLGPLLPSPRHQTIAVGILVGLIATISYIYTRKSPLKPVALLRYFLWPGFTMGVSYFLILAYLLRIIFMIELSPSLDLALLMAACVGWLSLESLFLGDLQRKQLARTPEASGRGVSSLTP